MAELEEFIVVHTRSALYNALGTILFWGGWFFLKPMESRDVISCDMALFSFPSSSTKSP